MKLLSSSDAPAGVSVAGAPRPRTLIPVLLYHAVKDHPARAVARHAVSRSLFTAHVDTIVETGRTPVLMSDLASMLRGQQTLPQRPIAITFDDGFADTYDAVDMLVERDMRATIYVTTGSIGAPDRLSPQRLVALGNHPSVELGAHSVSHPRLDELGGRTLDDEVQQSRSELEQHAQAPVQSFAYPHGAYDHRTRAAVVAAGYSSAAAVKNALSHADDDPFAIARWTVTPKTPASRIAQVLEGEAVPVAWPGERARTRLYRAVRVRKRQTARAISRLGGRSTHH